jgi:hypothetical protein
MSRYVLSNALLSILNPDSPGLLVESAAPNEDDWPRFLMVFGSKCEGKHRSPGFSDECWGLTVAHTQYDFAEIRNVSGNGQRLATSGSALPGLDDPE